MNKFKALPKGLKLLIYFGIAVVVLILLFVLLRLAYLGRIYPGVSANGTYLGGLTTAEAVKELDKQTSAYSQKPQTMLVGNNSVTVSAAELGTVYNNAEAANQALLVGRDGNIFEDLGAQISALVGLGPQVYSVRFDLAKLSSLLVAQNEQVSQLVNNASINFKDGKANISESKSGQRLDLGLSVMALQRYFGMQKAKPENLPILTVNPTISSEQLAMYEPLWDKMQTTPLSLTNGAQSFTIDQKTAADWLAASPTDLPLRKDSLNKYYIVPIESSHTYFDSAKIKAWVADLASKINVEPQDAELTMVGDKASVFAQSRDGKTLDQEATIVDIQKLLALDSSATSLPLSIKTTKAAVSSDTIDSLGIKELISEGVTYFPGSPSNRLQNVRAGASKFNGVLVKPGQVFSFGEYLGEVSAATGYAPGLIILGDHEEKAYGGGLCQVSSTAYRAALLAGLPIMQRTNHAFAISYYTAPYGVPGVDATIYYPQVDMKFLNDTGHYILMQTHMAGSTLKFSFYGTKTKSGTIRGPEFVSGNQDPTIPSHTVFYRDVLDLSGNVTKTDTIHTYYKSSLDFPITD
jgi:vancomycin resistance protein YoaR